MKVFFKKAYKRENDANWIYIVSILKENGTSESLHLTLKEFNEFKNILKKMNVNDDDENLFTSEIN